MKKFSLTIACVAAATILPPSCRSDTAPFPRKSGDANYDCTFNSVDLVQLFDKESFEQVKGGASWASGDFNGDGVFNSDDLYKAFQEGQYEKGPYCSEQPVVAVSDSGTFMVMKLAEKDPAKALIKQQIPHGDKRSSSRDLILTRNGKITVFSANLPPTLSTFDVYSNAWKHHKIKGLSLPSNARSGSIGAFGYTVYAPDSLPDGDGIVWLDTDGGRSGRFAEGTSFANVNAANGKILGLEAVTPSYRVHIFDAKTKSRLETLRLLDKTRRPADCRGITADRQGTLYCANADTEQLQKYSSTGAFVASAPVQGVSDVDLCGDTHLIVASESFAEIYDLNLKLVARLPRPEGTSKEMMWASCGTMML